MSAGVVEAQASKPASVTAPSFGDFLARRRGSVKEAGPELKPEETGASELPRGEESKKESELEKSEKKEKTAEELKKELSDQSRANVRLGKEKADLQRQLAEMGEQIKTIQAKQDGTYQEPSEEQKKREATLRDEFGRFEARKEKSKEEAIQEFGEDFVLNQIYHEHGAFTKLSQEKPWLVGRVMAAEKPVHEAIAAVHEAEVLAKFGRTEAEVLKKAEEILRPKLFEAFKQELDGSGPKPAARVPSLTQARAAGADPKLNGTAPVRTFSAGKLFPHNRV